MGQWLAGGLLEQGQTRPGEVRFSSLSLQLFPNYGQKLTQAEMTPYCVAKQKKHPEALYDRLMICLQLK